MSGDMVDTYLSQEFDVNSIGGVRENGIYGVTYDDGRRTHAP